MQNINLKRFVDINIQPHEVNAVVSTRDTALLYTVENHDNDGSLRADAEFSTYAEFEQYCIDNVLTFTYTDKYIKTFFDNNGVKVRVRYIEQLSDLTVDVIKELDNKYIYIALAVSNDDVLVGYNKMKLLATYLNVDYNPQVDVNSVYGINEKILLARTNIIDPTSENFDKDSTKNFAVKYSTQVGAEMTMAAYLSKINIDVENSIWDYAFTQEVIDASDISDSEYTNLQTYNINVDINLSGNVRNCGGNCKNGDDFVNNFVRIVLHQTLTEKLINLLTQKIKDSTGVSKIYTVIAQELERYKTAGYLSTDKVWTDSTLKVTRNNVTYIIINQGDALVNGYVIKVLPMSSLTEAEKLSKSAPPIYVIIADQYGIRKITLKGEAI